VCRAPARRTGCMARQGPKTPPSRSGAEVARDPRTAASVRIVRPRSRRAPPFPPAAPDRAALPRSSSSLASNPCAQSMQHASHSPGSGVRSPRTLSLSRDLSAAAGRAERHSRGARHLMTDPEAHLRDALLDLGRVQAFDQLWAAANPAQRLSFASSRVARAGVAEALPGRRRTFDSRRFFMQGTRPGLHDDRGSSCRHQLRSGGRRQTS
jgi:hypothetical protein